MSKNLFGEEMNINKKVEEPYTVEQNREFAAEKFKEVVEYLKENGNYNTIDNSLILIYATSICDLRRYTTILEVTGDLVTTARGKVEVHPYIPLKQKAFDNATKLAEKLGILAMSRKKLDGHGNLELNVNDPFNQFLPKED